ncbi:MAG TPA: hypothetical protein VIT23_14150 [Terrimicrobiaceae bacterium]
MTTFEKIVDSEAQARFWRPLGLPHNPAYWDSLHAVKTFAVLSDFLNYFFFEAVGYPYEGTQGRAIAATVPSSSIVAPPEGKKLPGDAETGPVQGETAYLTHKASREWDLEFAFLGYTTSGIDNKQIFPKRKWGDYSHCKVEDLTIPWQPVWYSVPTGLGIIMVGNKKKQKHRNKNAHKAVK